MAFQVRHVVDGKRIRTSFGRYPTLTLREARIKADELKRVPRQSVHRCHRRAGPKGR
ncbi:Arm DNA-binding domain-containing protein [Aeromonas popoffii]|uniref:Arm DNA-binding domain-containing protein n=1 Tax=Aeromonas popoffii TaxID=70856 RepID=UPI003BB1E107